MILVFDTETTGKADFSAPAAAEWQPHLVQLGAILMDADYKVRAEINLIVKPKGYVIPEEASNIHGITQAIAEKFGVPSYVAVSAFDHLQKLASVFVCHNFAFDHLIMRTASIRETDCSCKLDHLAHSAFCTMQATTPLCKLPGNYGFKWPKLQEAHKFAFGAEFEGAHDAMADVRACARLYRWLMDRARPAEFPPSTPGNSETSK